MRSTLLGQVTRYLSEEGVCAAIVVMQTRVPLPARICGKPVFTLPLNRLWGIALG